MADVFSHPWLGGLFGDPEIQQLLSAEVQLRNMLKTEAAYSTALGQAGLVDQETANAVAKFISTHEPDLGEIHQGTATDGVCVPALVRSLKAGLPDSQHAAVHHGMTSQDVIDTSLVLSLVDICALLKTRLSGLAHDLDALDDRFGANQMMGRTRMQAALPILVSERLRSWSQPLANHIARLEQLEPRLLQLQLGGAVGNRAVLASNGAAVAGNMAEILGLADQGGSWHDCRDNIAEFAGWLSLVSGSLGKIGQDIALMAQQGVDEISLSGTGGSSAMPHKKNPVLAELLVTLARYNATQLSGVHQSLVHEQERSGAAWALEWMLLPQMVISTGRALTTSSVLVRQITQIGRVD